MRIVYLSDIDITEYVIEIPDSEQAQGEFGQLLINDIPTMTGLNITSFWDQRYPGSPFYGAATLFDFPIRIEQDGVDVWKGHILSINADNEQGTAIVGLRSTLQATLEKGCIYVSSAPESPSQAIKNICYLYGIPIDTASFGYAEGIYSSDNVEITVLLVRPDMSVLDAIQQIANIGIAQVYSVNGVLYYDVYREHSAPAIYTFDDAEFGADLWRAPSVNSIEKEAIKGYSISYISGVAEFGTDVEKGKSIQAGGESPIRIETLQAATWVGEQWLSYLNRPQQLVQWECATSLAKSFILGSPIGISYTIGQWDALTVDLCRISPGDRLKSILTGRTR